MDTCVNTAIPDGE